jgi:hypothetical protein
MSVKLLFVSLRKASAIAALFTEKAPRVVP